MSCLSAGVEVQLYCVCMQESHAKLKSEIQHYQGTAEQSLIQSCITDSLHTIDSLAAKNSELDALQLSLEEIKFEK